MTRQLMHEATDTIDRVLLTANLILGFILIEHINIVVAIIGLISTVFAQLPRVVKTIIWLRDVKRSGWKIQKNDIDNETR